LHCLAKVHAGEPWLEHRATARAFDTLLRRETAARDMERILTTREIELVRRTATGLRNRAISERLNISEGTVKPHLHHIHEKFHMRSQVELIVFCEQKDIN